MFKKECRKKYSHKYVLYNVQLPIFRKMSEGQLLKSFLPKKNSIGNKFMDTCITIYVKSHKASHLI